MQFTNSEFNAFRKDFKEALKEVEEKYGIIIEPKNLTYTSNSFNLKVLVTNVSEEQKEQGLDTEQIAFERDCAKFGFTKEDYKRRFVVRGDTYELYGFKASARKNPCKVQNVRTGARYVCPKSFLIPESGHACKYCGAHVEGNNPDELCDDCKETFGHSLYTEL